MEQFNENGMILCQECGKPFNMITAAHLIKSHEMSMVDYKIKYEGFPLASKGFSAKQRMRNVKIFEDKKPDENFIDEIKDFVIKHENEPEEISIPQEIKIEECDDFDLDKIPIVSKDFTDSVSSFIEEVKTFTEENNLIFPNPNNAIHKDKIRILNFLLFYFHDLKNSYYIEKLSISGHLQYRLITDVCVPSLKLNIEFPNTFWHNQDVPKNSRDSILKNDGWKIINIPGPKPSLTELKTILKNFNLI